ncbi:MAG: hypothetical protein GY859_20485 [Desulfobacterales bacterium]|nr:hypothetical protein [Desulfobacterales bacterium]
MRYEKPMIIELSSIEQFGLCAGNGSGDTTVCNANGSSAGGNCSGDGGSPGGACASVGNNQV